MEPGRAPQPRGDVKDEICANPWELGNMGINMYVALEVEPLFVSPLVGFLGVQLLAPV